MQSSEPSDGPQRRPVSAGWMLVGRRVVIPSFGEKDITMLEYAMAVKALSKLVATLDASVTDRRTRDLFLPIKEAAVKVELEHVKSERQHGEEIERLKADHVNAMNHLETNLKTLHAQEKADLEDKYATLVQDLRSQIAHLRTQQPPQQDPKLVPHMGVLWKRIDSGYEPNPYCNECSHHPVMTPFPTAGRISFWICSNGHRAPKDVSPPTA